MNAVDNSHLQLCEKDIQDSDLHHVLKGNLYATRKNIQQKEILRHRRGHIGFDPHLKRQKQEILIRRKIQKQKHNHKNKRDYHKTKGNEVITEQEEIESKLHIKPNISSQLIMANEGDKNENS